MESITLRRKLVNGMQSLYNGMVCDLTGAIRQETPGTRIEHTDDGVRVTLEGVEALEADATMCAVLLDALYNIEFSSTLSLLISDLLDAKWNSQDGKIWIKIKGRDHFLDYAPKLAKISLLRSQYFMDDTKDDSGRLR